jgi:polyphosphate kinase
VNALINAVRNGKEVTVMLELRARFDEEIILNGKRDWNWKASKYFSGFPIKKYTPNYVSSRKE